MTNEEFEKKLLDLGLKKKEFARLSGMSYSGILNWRNPKLNIPPWVEPMLELYKRDRECERLKRALRDSGVCDYEKTGNENHKVVLPMKKME